MEPLHPWNISTQQIQIFLKAVELQNFTKVADFLNFTPSMVSKTIASMEDSLEIKLFYRTPQGLTPTPAGKILAADWRQLIGSMQNSIAKARACQNKEQRSLVFGFVDSSERIDELVRRSILAYEARCPYVRIRVEKHDMHRAAELLRMGMLDIMFNSAIETDYLDDHGIPWEKVWDTNVCAYVPEKNSRFLRERMELEDLKGSRLLSLDPLMHPSYKNWLDRLCESHGFSPDIAASFRTVRSLLFALKMQEHIFVGETITSEWCDASLKQFVFPEKSFTVLAWRRQGGKELLDFKNHLLNMLASGN